MRIECLSYFSIAYTFQLMNNKDTIIIRTTKFLLNYQLLQQNKLSLQQTYKKNR